MLSVSSMPIRTLAVGDICILRTSSTLPLTCVNGRAVNSQVNIAHARNAKMRGMLAPVPLEPGRGGGGHVADRRTRPLEVLLRFSQCVTPGAVPGTSCTATTLGG